MRRPSSSRWDASSRCTPMDRPMRPIWTNRSTNSGLAARSSPNSSMTTKSTGRGSVTLPWLRSSLYSPTLARLPAAWRTRWRRWISPRMESWSRSTRPAASSRLSTMAAVWGKGSRPAKVAPPLKSTSTRESWSGGWQITWESTRVRSTSDLPEPVAPTHRPWGPMPFLADSLMSSLMGFASESMP